MKAGISLSVSMKRFFNVVFCCLFLLVSCMDKTKMKTVSTPGNPYLPLWEQIPDGEPYVFEDSARTSRSSTPTTSASQAPRRPTTFSTRSTTRIFAAKPKVSLKAPRAGNIADVPGPWRFEAYSVLTRSSSSF